MPCDPWERQPDEGSKAFAAFNSYLVMGVGRSIRRLAAEKVETRGGGEGSAKVRRVEAARRQLEKWSSRWGWVTRARAYDADQAAQERVQRERDIKRMKERHLGIAVVGLNRIVDRLQALTPDEIPVRLIPFWLKTLIEIERISRDVPSKVEVVGQGEDGAIPVQLTLTETLERICEYYNLDRKLAQPQQQGARIDLEPDKRDPILM